jgi:hypothetical protein
MRTVVLARGWASAVGIADLSTRHPVYEIEPTTT